MSKTEMYFCSGCGKETPHVLVLVRKQSPFKNEKNPKRKDFIAGTIKGWALGPFISAMDEFERHLICEKCGKKIVEN